MARAQNGDEMLRLGIDTRKRRTERQRKGEALRWHGWDMQRNREEALRNGADLSGSEPRKY